MADDASAAGGPGGLREPGMGNHSDFLGGLGSSIWGQGQGHRAQRGKAEDKEWTPITKLRCLVKDMKIKSLVEIYLFSLPIKESEIIDFFLGTSLKDEVLKVTPVQKQTCTGQHTRFQVTGCCGSVLVRLIPAPRGTGILLALVPKKLLMMASINDCYSSARVCTATLANFTKPTYDKETVFTKSASQEFTGHLVKTHTRVSGQRTQAPAVATTQGFYTRKIK
uniref:Small ribosomal subunit protein uS5 n=1 Tax=Theropithecus gelada TaxID=9565 RepID=A0A8D2GLU0_THEGE